MSDTVEIKKRSGLAADVTHNLMDRYKLQNGDALYRELRKLTDRIEQLEAEVARLKAENAELEKDLDHAFQTIEKADAEILAMRNALHGAGVVVLGEKEWRWMEEGEGEGDE